MQKLCRLRSRELKFRTSEKNQYILGLESLMWPGDLEEIKIEKKQLVSSRKKLSLSESGNYVNIHKVALFNKIHNSKLCVENCIYL